MITTPSTSKQKKKSLPNSQAARLFSDHIRIEERSIALHRAVADRIRKNHKLMREAEQNLQRYLQQSFSEGGKPASSLLEWQELLENKSLEEVLEFMVSDSERARRMRQSSPFAGILTPKERWRIYEAYRPGTYYQSRGQHCRG
jgi:hypothetical protein